MATICDMAMGRLADRRYFLESKQVSWERRLVLTLPMVSSECVSRHCDLFTTETKKLSFFHELGRQPHFTLFLILVKWHESGHKISYSHFFRGGWHHVLQWCNVRAHKRFVCTIDFQPTLMYQSTSADLRQQCSTSFCPVCGVLFYCKRKSTVVSSGVSDVMLVTHICSHSAECSYATFCNQTWYYGAPPWSGMSCKKIGFYLQGQGHSVGLYDQNMTVSTISFISSKPASLLQPNSIWV